MSLENKKILLIVGGGISAYKSLDLIRLLQRKNCSLKIIYSPPEIDRTWFDI